MEHFDIIRSKINKAFEDLEFYEESHDYIHKGDSLTPVSSTLKPMQKKFPAKVIAEAIARRDGVSPEEILEKWERKARRSRETGKRTHRFAEHYIGIESGLPGDWDRKEYEKTNLIPQEIAFLKFMADMPEHYVPMYVELKMYNLALGIGGTADLILFDKRDNSLAIFDYKTNESLFKQHNDQKLLSPFKDLDDNPFNKFQLQLSLYDIILSTALQDKYKVSKRAVVWLKSDESYSIFNCADYKTRLYKKLC